MPLRSPDLIHTRRGREAAAIEKARPAMHGGFRLPREDALSRRLTAAGHDAGLHPGDDRLAAGDAAGVQGPLDLLEVPAAPVGDAPEVLPRGRRGAARRPGGTAAAAGRRPAV